MNLISRLQYLLIIALALGLSLPDGSKATLKERVTEVEFANGFKALLAENPGDPVISFQIWYRVGSRNETWGQTGLSHLLEHMMFKGTSQYGPGAFDRVIQENGGILNAMTSRDFTVYFENISADRFKIPMRLEADRMTNPGPLFLRDFMQPPFNNILTTGPSLDGCRTSRT